MLAQFFAFSPADSRGLKETACSLHCYIHTLDHDICEFTSLILYPLFFCFSIDPGSMFCIALIIEALDLPLIATKQPYLTF